MKEKLYSFWDIYQMLGESQAIIKVDHCEEEVYYFSSEGVMRIDGIKNRFNPWYYVRKDDCIKLIDYIDNSPIGILERFLKSA